MEGLLPANIAGPGKGFLLFLESPHHRITASRLIVPRTTTLPTEVRFCEQHRNVGALLFRWIEAALLHLFSILSGRVLGLQAKHGDSTTTLVVIVSPYTYLCGKMVWSCSFLFDWTFRLYSLVFACIVCEIVIDTRRATNDTSINIYSMYTEKSAGLLISRWLAYTMSKIPYVMTQCRLVSSSGKQVKEAGAAEPVRIAGMKGTSHFSTKYYY